MRDKNKKRKALITFIGLSLLFILYSLGLFYSSRKTIDLSFENFKFDIHTIKTEVSKEEIIKTFSLFKKQLWKSMETIISGYLGLCAFYFFVIGVIIYKQGNKIRNMEKLKDKIKELKESQKIRE